MRTTFLIGRLTSGSTEMVVVAPSAAPSPFPGPWQLRALVRRERPPLTSRAPDPVVH